MDNIVYEQSVSNDVPPSNFVNKKWVYVNDLNQGSYQSQVILDTTALSNQGGWVNYSEGYIAMPLIVTLTSTIAASLPTTANIADYSWGFKNGFWQIINSMSVQYNNSTVVSETPFLNVFKSFEAMTKWSLDDLFNDGPTCCFYPDNPSSWSYAAASSNTTPISGNGIGLCNNRNAPLLVATAGVASAAIDATTPFYISNGLVGNTTSAGATTTTNTISGQNPAFGNPTSHNDGFLQRQFYVSYDPSDNGIAGLNQGAINNANSCSQNFRNYKLTQTSAGIVQWSIVAKLRLKDLADFFAKMPLVKGGTVRIMINTNQAITTFAVTKGTANPDGSPLTYPTLTCTGTTVNGGLTCPIMVASANPNQGCSALPADTYNLSVAIYQNNFTAQQSSTYVTQKSQNLTCCRLYAPIYTMDPSDEKAYLALNNGIKSFTYNDIYQFQYTSIGAGQSFNFLVTNGIPHLRQILCIPLINSQSNGASAVSTLLSPFCGTGGCPDPIQLTNFNIKISGGNLFMDNEYYDYEAFLQQLRTSYQVNGNATTGVTSGLINESMFSRGMRYYFGDASRIAAGEDALSRSVSVLGQNSSLLTMDLLVFIVYAKELSINLSNGETVKQA
jgi:hypothetical protein